MNGLSGKKGEEINLWPSDAEIALKSALKKCCIRSFIVGLGVWLFTCQMP